MKRPTTRLALGVGVLAVIALTAILTTTSVLAQVTAPPTFSRSTLACATGTGLAQTGATTTTCSISPGGTYTLLTEHSFASTPAQTGTGVGTSVRRAIQLHQRMEADARYPAHTAGSHWFYLIAENVAPATGTGTANTALSYYAPPRRTQVSIATSATVCAGTGAACTASAPAGSDIPATIYAQAGNRAPIVDVESLSFATTASAFFTAPVFISSTMTSTLRWGHAQEWWAAGTVGFNARADQFAGPGQTTGVGTGWTNTGVGPLTLVNTAPTNTVSGGGNRVVAANSNAPYIITVADANGDIRKVRLVFRRVSGPSWFTIAAVPGDNDRDTTNSSLATSTVEYQSDVDAYQALPGSTGLFTTYLGQSTAGGTTTNSGIGSASGGAANSTSVTYTFNVIPTSNARGMWNVYAQSVDFHGGNTGSVLVGTLTVQ